MWRSVGRWARMAQPPFAPLVDFSILGRSAQLSTLTEFEIISKRLDRLEGYIAHDAKKQIRFTAGEVLKWIGGTRPTNRDRSKSDLFSRPNGHYLRAGLLLGFKDVEDFASFARGITHDRNEVDHVLSLEELDNEVKTSLKAISLFPTLRISNPQACNVIANYKVLKKQVPKLFKTEGSQEP